MRVIGPIAMCSFSLKYGCVTRFEKFESGISEVRYSCCHNRADDTLPVEATRLFRQYIGTKNRRTEQNRKCVHSKTFLYNLPQNRKV